MACRRPLLGLSFVALFGLILLLSLSSSAEAGTVHPFVSSFEVGLNPQALTVDQATGEVLVVDVAAGAVLKFDAAGSPSSFSALGTNVLDGNEGADQTPHGGFSFDSPSAAQVAVDNAGGPADGFIYVANLSGAVDVFDTTGTFVGEIDGSAASPQSGGELCGVATDPAGDVYASYFSGHVDKYTPTDANPADDTFDGQLQGLFHSCNVAADSLGNVYVSGWPSGPLKRYASSQLNQGEPSGSVVDETSQAVAVDPETNDVFVDEGEHVVEFNGEGVEAGISGGGHLSGQSFGVGFDAASGELYASDTAEAGGEPADQVRRYGPGEIFPNPVVTIEPPTEVTSTHATFRGTVNPGGTEPISDTTWHFEYSLDDGETWTSTTGGDAGVGTSPVPVSDEVSTFLPDQKVEVRLRAANSAGRALSNTETFTTTALPPDVVTEQAQDITPDHAVFEATLNAHNAPATYWFEYGTTIAYGQSIPAAHDGDGGSSPDTIAVTRALYTLSPGTTYHYRIVAQNISGTIRGADQAFTTMTPLPASPSRPGIPGNGLLPDSRGWEQVSAPDKHGADVMINSARVQVARSETPSLPMAATFGSLGGFADPRGSDVATDYMAVRTGDSGSSGWVTHGINPPQEPLTILEAIQGIVSQWEGEFSPDLTTGVFRSWTSLTEAPEVRNVMNLYRRDDLHNPGAGTYQLLSDCPACETPLPPISQVTQVPGFAGASADFSHVIFESTYPLLAGSTAGEGNPNLYEWDNGVLRLAGVLPETACGIPPCVASTSVAGQGTGTGGGTRRISPDTISSDGSRVLFTDTSMGSLAEGSGNLYMRIDGSSTVQLNASEKSVADSSLPATFQTASTDGSRVFFTTHEQLTDDPTNGSGDLYMYDVDAPAGHHLTLISIDHEPADAPNGVQGVIGASADGHYVYFVASGQLVAGQPVLRSLLGIYEWHDGVTAFVGRLANLGASNDESFDVLPNVYGLAPMAARVTADGRHMLFRSSSGEGLTGYDSSGHPELYLYGADRYTLQCVSCRADGSPAAGDASDMSSAGVGGSRNPSHLSNPVTADGSKVFFTTTDSLVPEDLNGKSDAYEFDSSSGTVHLLSSGSDPSDSYFMDASANGADAVFLTRQQLVGWDTDQNYDLYDARVGGGLPEPGPSQECTIGACHGAVSAAPSAPFPATSSFSGMGDVNPHVINSPKPGSKRLTNAQKLATALKSCRKKPKGRRRRCEALARKRFHTHKAPTRTRRAKP